MQDDIDMDISEGNISLKLPVKIKLDHLPNLSADVRFSFGLAEKVNRITNSEEKITVNLDVPFFLKPIISRRIITKKIRAAENCIHGLIQGIVSLINQNKLISCTDTYPSKAFIHKPTLLTTKSRIHKNENELKLASTKSA
jgi:hypothetical protein